MENVTVSVIVPVHNSAATIGQAVESALVQKVPLEIIVVDDGSTDDLEGALARYANLPQLRCLHNERNLGVAASRNRGVEAARGEYIAFLDADDWWEPRKLAAQLQVMRRRNVVLSCTGRELMRADGSSTGRFIPVRERITYRSLLYHNCINCSSVLIRADVAREFPMEHDEAHEDYIMWLHILKKYGEAAGLPHSYLKYRMAANSKSGSKLHSAGMTYRVYRYMGYGPLASLFFFASYALHGVWKYAGARRRSRGKG
ncbi:MAG: glycosyltransferase [Lachnospiraceae bacterium]|nr:glycosyltransferase [Lachnospiraceae bacterium]